MITRTATCRCGRVQCEAMGPPILSGVCYCLDCQAAGLRLEALADAAPVRDEDGGTPYLTYRDDRFHCVSGQALLVPMRLTEKAPTRRMIADCCNTAMFLKFGPGHWVSAYRHRFDGDAPPIEMRTKVGRRVSDVPLPGDAPAYRSFPVALLWRLIRARMAMWFGR